VCVLSLCSSHGEYWSRGLGFVLDKNRVKAAISRAQCLAVVVADPRIAESSANSLDAYFGPTWPPSRSKLATLSEQARPASVQRFRAPWVTIRASRHSYEWGPFGMSLARQQTRLGRQQDFTLTLPLLVLTMGSTSASDAQPLRPNRRYTYRQRRAATTVAVREGEMALSHGVCLCHSGPLCKYTVSILGWCEQEKYSRSQMRGRMEKASNDP
jgi:hypothetical protein